MPNDDELMQTKPYGPLGLIALPSFMDRAKEVDKYLADWRSKRTFDNIDDFHILGYHSCSYLMDVNTPRFGSGEGKATLNHSIRGLDVYILTDIMNHSITYKLSGVENRMSPDDHFADLKRVIGAIGGKAIRINVILPFLYESRQHRRMMRESLDCAIALQELVSMGVTNIITFDAHDPRVNNAIPLSGFDTVRTTYQSLKCICHHVDDLKIDKDHLMIISPDEGGTDRAVYMASVLGVEMGMFYKRRDFSQIINGKNPIVAHEFLGSSVEGKDVIVVDDMISSGDSMIDVATELKKRKANRVFCVATFGLFTNGMESFDKAVEEGIIYRVVCTDLTYQKPEVLSRDYYLSCPMSKYIAYIIDTLNHNSSMSDLLDPSKRITRLIREYSSL